MSLCQPEEARVTLKHRAAGSEFEELLDMTSNPAKAAVFDGQVVTPEGKVEVVKKSQSMSLETENLTGRDQIRSYSTLGEIMDVYPNLDWSDLTESRDMALRSSCKIASSVVKVGKLKFGNDAQCKASFSFWKRQSDQESLASEFSFVCNRTNDEIMAAFQDLLTDELVNSVPDAKTAIARRCTADRG